MIKKVILSAIVAFISTLAIAQTDLQVQYDFGRGELVTATLEVNSGDFWGSTYLFVDLDNCKGNPGVYGEIARSFNFWRYSSWEDFSVQVEYDAGMYKDFIISPAFLAGFNYSFYPGEKNFLQVQALYKTFFNREVTKVPLQFTLVWECSDIFNVSGLEFMGFADFWWQDQYWVDKTATVFMTEPQLWYNVGQWFNTIQLNVGGEVEIGYNFALKGFSCYPSLGIKWVF